MTTRADLRNLCRRRLGDNSTPYHFSDLQINQYINDAIADYSISFPRKLNTTLNCSTNDKTYDLPAGFRGPISVEYPSGEDPPKYLKRLDYTMFCSDDRPGYYDIIRRDQQSDVNELWISEKPTTGETIVVYFLADHDSLDDDPDVCTILDRHLELIVLFVRWACFQELATTESMDPDPTNLSLGTLELNAFRAKREYRTKLDDWLVKESESGTITWSMDQYDRVY